MPAQFKEYIWKVRWDERRTCWSKHFFLGQSVTYPRVEYVAWNAKTDFITRIISLFWRSESECRWKYLVYSVPKLLFENNEKGPGLARSEN